MDPLPGLILAKVQEQIERTEHLLGLIPPDKIDWQPDPNSRRLSELLGHLLDCLAGFCAAVCISSSRALCYWYSGRLLAISAS